VCGEKEPRELTREERAEIKRLVTALCANYSREYGCLPLDGACYMLGKWYTGAYCKYFREAVLPLNPSLEAALTSEETYSLRKLCAVCGGGFIPTTSQAYCSRACRVIGQRADSRRRQRKKRAKRGT
jgi:hypothetical protein